MEGREFLTNSWEKNCSPYESSSNNFFCDCVLENLLGIDSEQAAAIKLEDVCDCVLEKAAGIDSEHRTAAIKRNRSENQIKHSTICNKKTCLI